jgi:hypothetical protein
MIGVETSAFLGTTPHVLGSARPGYSASAYLPTHHLPLTAQLRANVSCYFMLCLSTSQIQMHRSVLARRLSVGRTVSFLLLLLAT